MIISSLTRFYGKLHNYKGIPYWLLTPIRKLTRMLVNMVLPYYVKRVHNKNLITGKGIIISLTSFPDRINSVWLVVESLKNQSIKPEKIILWLSKEQFPAKDDIPVNLWECEDAFFEIRMVDDDIRSHKKYYYAIQEYPEKTIVTCDDDVYYHPDMLKNLVKVSKHYPNCIIANNTSQISWDTKGELMPYKKWSSDFKAFSSLNNVQIGIGGVLYPPHCLHPLVTRADLFCKLSPLADDLWLNLMARLNGTPVVQTPNHIQPLPVECEAPSLSSVNNGADNMNDRQIQQMREWLSTQGIVDVYSQEYRVEA